MTCGEFRRHGVLQQNIWAVERDRKTFASAATALRREGEQVKLHRGNLESFFASVPAPFDIIYIDATGPLFGGEPNTIHVIRELFVNQRLAPLAALITNFAEPNKDGQNTRFWSNHLGVWAYAHQDLSGGLSLPQQFIDDRVSPRILEVYGDFVTEFLVQFSGQLLPWWRTTSDRGAKSSYFTEPETLKKATAKAIKVAEALLHPFYGHLRHLVFSTDPGFSDQEVWRSFFQRRLGEAPLEEAIQIASLIRTFYEAHFGNVFFETQHLRDGCNPELARVLTHFRWFDQGLLETDKVFCDVPLPNLVADLLLGLHGYPYHANAREHLRLAYKAKETRMLTDVFVLDQARYLYDQFTTLPFINSAMPVPQQLLVRVCIDALHRHTRYCGCPDLFYGGALASEGEEGFKYSRVRDRECIGCDLEDAEGTTDPDVSWRLLGRLLDVTPECFPTLLKLAKQNPESLPRLRETLPDTLWQKLQKALEGAEGRENARP